MGFWTLCPKVGADHVLGRFRDGDHALFPALSEDTTHSVRGVEILDSQRQDLSGSQAAEEHESGDGKIPIGSQALDELLGGLGSKRLNEGPGNLGAGPGAWSSASMRQSCTRMVARHKWSDLVPLSAVAGHVLLETMRIHGS